MEFLHRLMRLASETIVDLFYGWPVTLVLCALVMVSVRRWPADAARLGAKDYAVLASPLVAVVVVLVIGAAFVPPPMIPTTYPAKSDYLSRADEIGHALDICALLQLAASVALIIRRRGIRLHVASIMVVQLWLSLCAQIVAGSAFTGK